MPQKTKNLKENHKFALQGMRKNGVSPEDAADFLNLVPESAVEYYAELTEEEARENSTLINRTANGNKGVAVMTQAGSERVDYLRERSARVAGKHQVDAIHNIK